MQLRKLLEEHEVRLLQKLVKKTFGKLYGSTNARDLTLKYTKVNGGKGEKRDFDTMNKTVDVNTHKISGGKNSANFSEISSNYREFPSNNFSGPIPSDLLNSPSLQLLNVSHNSLQGNLPPKFKYLVFSEPANIFNIFLKFIRHASIL